MECSFGPLLKLLIQTDDDHRQFIILGIRKFPVQLFRQHSGSIKYPAGYNTVFHIKLLLGLHVNQQLDFRFFVLARQKSTEPDIVGYRSLSRNLAFRVLPVYEPVIHFFFAGTQRYAGYFDIRLNPESYFLRGIRTVPLNRTF